LQKEAQICVVGKVFRPNKSKVLALNNALTPYWLTLSLNRKERISLPIVFGGKQKQRIEEALKGEWKFAAVEMVKRDGEWYARA
jgi:hypothetical protein